VERSGDHWRNSGYRLPIDRMMLGELFLMGYALFAAVLISQRDGLLSAPFMLLYAASFAAVAFVSLWQGRPQRAGAADRTSNAASPAKGDDERRTLAGANGAASPPAAVHAPSAEVLVKTTIARVE
jgi:hypothetical protein